MSEIERGFFQTGERVGMRYKLAVPRSTASSTAGLQLGQRAGSSLEFRDHRDYQPGDDLRRIDWNAFARSDKLIVKLYREEINPHLDIVLDGSRSMALAESSKREVAMGLAAIMAVAAENAGYSHNAWIARDWCIPVINGNNRPSRWEAPAFDFRGNPAEAFVRLPQKFRRQGVRALISDLLWLGEPSSILHRLALGASAVFVIQVLAAADVNPPERGRLRLVDSETDEQREIFIDEKAIGRYRNALTRHQQNWHSACKQFGAVMVNLTAEHVIADWNLEALVKAEILRA